MNPHYSATIFQAAPPPDGWPGTFAIITAWNPLGQNVSDALNSEFDRALKAQLEGTKPSRWHWRVLGGSPDFVQTEAGFAVNLPLTEALAIGLKFKQEAIFWIENDELRLIACEGAEQQHLGLWSERLTRGNALPRNTKHPG